MSRGPTENMSCMLMKTDVLRVPGREGLLCQENQQGFGLSAADGSCADTEQQGGIVNGPTISATAQIKQGVGVKGALLHCRQWPTLSNWGAARLDTPSTCACARRTSSSPHTSPTAPTSRPAAAASASLSEAEHLCYSARHRALHAL